MIVLLLWLLLVPRYFPLVNNTRDVVVILRVAVVISSHLLTTPFLSFPSVQSGLNYLTGFRSSESVWLTLPAFAFSGRRSSMWLQPLCSAVGVSDSISKIFCLTTIKQIKPYSGSLSDFFWFHICPCLASLLFLGYRITHWVDFGDSRMSVASL